MESPKQSSQSDTTSEQSPGRSPMVDIPSPVEGFFTQSEEQRKPFEEFLQAPPVTEAQFGAELSEEEMDRKMKKMLAELQVNQSSIQETRDYIKELESQEREV